MAVTQSDLDATNFTCVETNVAKIKARASYSDTSSNAFELFNLGFEFTDSESMPYL